MAKIPRLRSVLSSVDLPARPGAALVRLSDETRGIRIAVVPAAGGEIGSVKVRIGNRWREILYRALDYESEPPDGWCGRAPLLWPACGRSLAADQIAVWRRTGRLPKAGRFVLGGRAYPMPDHGFARNMAWELDSHGVKADCAWARCILCSSARTRRMFPFHFRIAVTHMLANGDIFSLYEVVAGDNSKPMPFCIGNHISFRVPFTAKGRFEECTVRTPGRKSLHLNDLTLLSGRSSRMDLSKPVPLGSGIYADTLLAGYTWRTAWAELADPLSLKIRVSQRERRMGGKGCADERNIRFVFWGSPELNYVCPEPWLGEPNALNTGKGLVRLGPRERFIWEMRVRVTPRLSH